jgi:flagellar basal-body rod protein FlgC
MSFFDSLNISATGLTAERMQMDVTSENLANANSTNNGTPYKPQAVELQSIGSGNTFQSELSSAMGGSTDVDTDSDGQTPGGVEVTGIVNENVPDQLVYDPGNPQANKQGYVKEPDVQPVTEMTNLISESNAYQADVTAMSTSKQMYSDTLQILK